MACLESKSYARITSAEELPRLIEVQLESFHWLQTEGLAQLFDEISPIESFNGNLKLYFPGSKAREAQFDLSYRFGEPKYSEEECLERDITYAAPLYVQVVLDNRETGEIVESEIFLGDFPLMTENGTFIINGTERVVVSQLIRSPGVYFDVEEDRVTGRRLSTAKLIPDRGAWMEFETRKSDYLTIKFNRKRTLPVTILLRALAAVDDRTGDNILGDGSDEELLALFQDADSNPQHQYIATTIRQEPHWEPRDGRTLAEEALLEFYRRMRPGDPPTLENAREYLEQQLFDPRRYDLQRVGRYKLNQRLGLDMSLDHRTVTKRDLVALVERLIRINNGIEDADDIDHLGNRRVKTVGELVQNKLRIGLRRMERVVVERMSIRESESLTPVSLINIRPVVAALREFFGSSQLSQFMEQTNPLAELTHKRTLSALGPGGLRRERARFDVRDVHYSHYGRICPIETPEGPNIGLIGRLATHARVNSLGFIETPYRKVIRAVEPTVEALTGQTLREDIVDPESGEVVAEAGTEVTPELAERIAALGLVDEVPIVPVVSSEIVYLTADKEDQYTIAQSNAELDEKGHFVQPRISARRADKFLFAAPERIDYIDVAPCQIVGVSASLIPFLEHDDANRALMGSNMQRQAVPLIQPEAPIVATGMERRAALDSGQFVFAEDNGEVVSVTGDRIVVRYADGLRVYPLRKYQRSNQSTCIDQRPVVYKGQRVRKGQVLADSSSTEGGELALGHNVVCAFLSWEGGNFEDAILISERLVREDKFTSIHIEKHEVEARDTKLGLEEITRDIPNVGDEALKDLDESGIIRVGAEVGPLDILVGKITPKGEKELSPEEKLLRAIFGEKAREVKDSSLRLPHGERGKVVDVKVFDREEHRDLKAGVEKMVRVSVAQLRKITEGDKMAGRHGNKGVISQVVPIEDMPFLPDGTPVDLILNPLGVPGRMNIGQILETHLGWAASRLGFRAVTPVFDGANESQVEAELARAWLIDRAWDEITERAWAWLKAQDYPLETLRDDDEARRLYIVAWLAERGYDVDRLIMEHIYARRAVLREWLRERGYDPDELLSFGDDTRTLAEGVVADQRARITCLRVWLEDRGREVADLDDDAVEALARQVSMETSDPLPILGKMILRDGKTGEPFDRPVTVGVIYMMKLAHLVEDKVHARSTGPYSLVTQQPLGGKAQFGGQRFGEMEVWALEAYGAAHALQEMLTIKSDDVQGRVKTYEAIVKGEPVQEPGVPASFKVLVKELQSLGLAVEAVTQDGEVLHFGRDEEKTKVPKLGMGLLGLGQQKR
ncbi:MAG: DNA-directed RNA polymerase subunit beta [Chloroflexi bacterium]|nr:MAG: DNA-directed RNA polymerase subunit beta [Chloroflexota bacterium]RLC90763.1 MAG: DNA-directed RNA polymerase subunit beta [Chloroflexota bacterium]HEY66931.1 DNA-directed RNA polymerase subunit beta [Thermoflexia bacterium]